MKLSRLFLLSAFSVLVNVLYCQNKIMVLNPGDSIDHRIKFPVNGEGIGYSSDFIYRISPAPTAVRTGLPVNCDLQDAAQKSVNRFQSVHLYNGYVDLGRDFLDIGYVWTHNTDYDGASYRIMSRKDSTMKSRLMTTLFSNTLMQEAVYEWLLPAYLDAYSLMSVPEQKAYIRMFEEGIRFADTFNLETQTLVVENSENYATEVGGLNAFIYRRVNNKQLTRQDCSRWLHRIVSELEKNQKQNPEPADEFVLMGSLGYGYYSATDYTNANGYEAEFSILRRQEEGFEILPVPTFRYGNYGTPESNFFQCYNYSNDYARYLFYCDSTGWTYTKTPYDEDVKGYAFMGSGKSARVLLIYYYDFDFTETGEEYDNVNLTMAAVVDLDSGYIVHDSVGVPEYIYFNENEESRAEYPTLNKDRTVFYCYTTNAYGVMDRAGNILLQPIYKAVELTEDPEIVKVNGKKLVSVRGGGKPAKKKKQDNGNKNPRSR